MVDHSVPEIEELIGAYALDAVDDDEREAVEQHLAVVRLDAVPSSRPTVRSRPCSRTTARPHRPMCGIAS